MPITALDNNKKGVLYLAEKEGTLFINMGKPLQLTWKPYQSRILVAVVPEGIIIDQLFVNGERQCMARFSNTKAGFQTGDIIQMVNGSRVSAISDLQ